MATVNVACIGDSLTAGEGETPYTTPLQSQLTALADGNIYTVENIGTPGIKMVTIDNNYAAFYEEKYDPLMDVNIILLWGGTNDFHLEQTLAPGLVNDAIASFTAKARVTGWNQVIVMPLIQRGWVSGGTLADTRTGFTLVNSTSETLADENSDIVFADTREISGNYDSLVNPFTSPDAETPGASEYLDSVHLLSASYVGIATFMNPFVVDSAQLITFSNTAGVVSMFSAVSPTTLIAITQA